MGRSRAPRRVSAANGCPWWSSSRFGDDGEGGVFVARAGPNRVMLHQAANDGCTPLFMACQKGHLKIAALLVDKGAKIDQAKNDGATPLFIACQQGHLKVAALLVDKGAKIDQAMNDGSTPLSVACQNGRLEVAALLLDKGANVEQGESDGGTTLMQTRVQLS